MVAIMSSFLNLGQPTYRERLEMILIGQPAYRERLYMILIGQPV